MNRKDPLESFALWSGKRRSILIPLAIVVLISGAYIMNHQSKEWIISQARRDLVDRSMHFDSALKFCQDLSMTHSANVSLSYYGKSDFGALLTFKDGRDTFIKLERPDFVSGLYFDYPGLNLSYSRQKDKLVISYPYTTYDFEHTQIIHRMESDSSELLYQLSGGWHLRFYKVQSL